MKNLAVHDRFSRMFLRHSHPRHTPTCPGIRNCPVNVHWPACEREDATERDPWTREASRPWPPLPANRRPIHAPIHANHVPRSDPFLNSFVIEWLNGLLRSEGKRCPRENVLNLFVQLSLHSTLFRWICLTHLPVVDLFSSRNFLIHGSNGVAWFGANNGSLWAISIAGK